MKNAIIIISLMVINVCFSQKRQTMEYFNIDKYKDWETNNDYSSAEESKFLKKENKKVEITIDKDKTYVTQSENQNPYENIFVYSNKTKMCIAFYREFYGINIGKMMQYDENGKLIKEKDYDKPYKFSLKEVIEKIKKEYEIDLEDLTQRCVLERFESVELNKKPLYTAYLRNNDTPGIMDYIVIDGTTGETLFKTDMELNGEGEKTPYYKYIESLKKAEQENNAYYKTYKGKDYTKKEWEVFEEKWYEDYKKNKDRSFWDDIFKRP